MYGNNIKMLNLQVKLVLKTHVSYRTFYMYMYICEVTRCIHKQNNNYKMHIVYNIEYMSQFILYI